MNVQRGGVTLKDLREATKTEKRSGESDWSENRAVEVGAKDLLHLRGVSGEERDKACRRL